MDFRVGDIVRKIISSNTGGNGCTINVGDIGTIVKLHSNGWVDICLDGKTIPWNNPDRIELVERTSVDCQYFDIKQVIFNPPATIILWNDNTKSVVKCQDGEPYDAEKGFALAYLKKLLGNDNTFNKEIHKWVK